MTCTVREARPAEFDAVAALCVAAYRADGQLDAGNGYERSLADVASRAAGATVLVAVDDGSGELLGTVTFALPGSPYAQLATAGEAEFRMLAVDPGAQGRGVGAALVRACLDRAAALGCEGVVICTRDIAARARRLYEHLGFVRVPERDWSPAPGIFLLALRVPLPAVSGVTGARGGASGVTTAGVGSGVTTAGVTGAPGDTAADGPNAIAAS